jgi:hypothetical protein
VESHLALQPGNFLSQVQAPRAGDGAGCRGGILDGSVVDHTASQGSLGLDTQHGLLYSVNAGSNTISVFAVHGERLALRQVLGSGGRFPVSVTVHGDLVYVLNALNGGSVQGYRVLGTTLVPLLGALLSSASSVRRFSGRRCADPSSAVRTPILGKQGA